jgi:probable HAF family extracellular repeat protein
METRAINDAGQIVGYGINPDGYSRAYLLTPVPEPMTLGLLTVGALSLLRLRK